nr:putative Gag-Pol polyprotein [Tanacetum cinerariifolium]
METINVKFDELTNMASECNNSGFGLNCSNFQDSSEELNKPPSKEDLDKLFGPLYEDYYVTRNLEVSDNFAANSLDNEDTHFSSSIIIEYHEAPQIVSSSEEPITQELTTLVFDNHSDEQIQKDSDGFVDPYFPNHVYRLKKALYGLKQAPRACFFMAQQQIIPTDQLVTTKYQSIGRCTNYAVLQNISCPKECKILGQLLVNHALIYALTKIADVLVLPVEPTTLKFIQSFLKIVGYQGNVDKVNAYYTKNLAQPWQMMFKVFNHCLTLRTSGHDQTKINILQIFHVVINRVQTTRNVTVRGMLILDEFLTYNTHATLEYKEYEKVFVGLDVPKIKPQLVESTQGTNRTPSAHRTPTRTAIISDQIKSSTTPIPPLSDDREMDEIVLSLTMHKTALVAEAQENVAKVQDKLLEEDIEKIVECEDEEYFASAFANSIFLNEEEDTGTRSEPWSHKENPKTVNDDAVENKDDKKDDDYHTDHTLVKE